MKKLNCFTVLMFFCLFCSKIEVGTLLLFTRHMAPCVTVSKRGIRQQWGKDERLQKAGSSEMVQTIVHDSVDQRRDVLVRADRWVIAEEGQVPVLGESSHFSLYLP